MTSADRPWWQIKSTDRSIAIKRRQNTALANTDQCWTACDEYIYMFEFRTYNNTYSYYIHVVHACSTVPRYHTGKSYAVHAEFARMLTTVIHNYF